VYDLAAVICHSGGLVGGHYTTYAQNPLTHRLAGSAVCAPLMCVCRWYLYDDINVEAVDAEEVMQAQAYMLFYRFG
jgi:ubiquitin C-terminal hydrolase